VTDRYRGALIGCGFFAAAEKVWLADWQETAS